MVGVWFKRVWLRRRTGFVQRRLCEEEGGSRRNGDGGGWSVLAELIVKKSSPVKVSVKVGREISRWLTMVLRDD